MSDFKGNAICTIGMHRSATLMIPRLLHQCGLYLGTEDQLLGAHYGNPEGHFEPTGFLNIDDARLRHLDGSWEFPPTGTLNEPCKRTTAGLIECTEILSNHSACVSPESLTMASVIPATQEESARSLRGTAAQ